MPDPVIPGVKSPAGTPPAGTGESNAAGSPPVDDLEFQDDQVVEQDGKKMVPLEVVLGERKKWKDRMEKAVPPATEPEPEPESETDQPLFNWDKLVPQQQGAQSPQPVGSQGPPPVDPNQFEDRFRDMLNDKPWQAIMWAMQTGMQYRDQMEAQARRFVPDYGNLPVHDVSDQEVQMLASNPYAMKAMIAKAKAATGGRQQRTAATPVQPAPATPPASPVSNEAIKAAVELINSLGKTSGVSGEGTRGPSIPPAGDTVELDKDAVAYFKARGYSDDQIKQQAQRIVDIRRRRGQM